MKVTDSEAAIHQRYRKLVFKVHPDRQPPDKREEAEKLLKKINIAYGKIKKGESSKAEPKPERKNSASPKPEQETFYTYDYDLWDNWGQRIDWGSLAAAFRSAIDGMAKTKNFADSILARIYPDVYAERTKNPYHYDSLRDMLARLLKHHEFHSFVRNTRDPDPVSAVVNELYHGENSSYTLPGFDFSGRTFSFSQGLGFLGIDPRSRNFHIAGLPDRDRYHASESIRQSGRQITAITAFIYANFDRIRYIPIEGANQIPRTGTVNSWGTYTGYQLATTVLPFIEHSHMRTELLLEILGYAGNIGEFTEFSAIYLHEVAMQKIYRSSETGLTTMEQAWKNVERAREARAEDLKIPFKENLMFLLYKLPMVPKTGLSVFRRKSGALDPAEWIHEIALKRRAEWWPILDVHEKLEVIPQMFRELGGEDAKLTADLVNEVDLAIKKDLRQRLVFRVQAEKLEEPLKSKVLEIVQSHSALHRASRFVSDCAQALLKPPGIKGDR